MKKDWIKELPPGEYTMKQIKEFAGLVSHGSAKIILMKYGAKMHKLPVKGSNFSKDIFYWPGFKQKNKNQKSC